MQKDQLEQLLRDVRCRNMSVDQALSTLQRLPFETIADAKIDHHRSLRCGFPEVIYCEGKTAEQVATIFSKLAAAGGNVLATRATGDQYQAVRNLLPDAAYHDPARCITYRRSARKPSTAKIVLLAAGTTDLAVIEEARITCEFMDQDTQTIVDVGVAGLPRLLAQTEILQSARVIVVAAGMDGALPGVVCGMVAAPVVAVPTSVGYGAHFNGLAPLLTMLNTCAPGVAVVNIDNGFAAGYLASMINRLGEKQSE